MTKRYYRIANIFGESELCVLEDALTLYIDSLDSKSDTNMYHREMVTTLKEDLTFARRWRHQYDKSEH